MEITFKFNKEEVFLIANALEINTGKLLKQGEDEDSWKTNKLKEKLIALYNLELFEVEE